MSEQHDRNGGFDGQVEGSGELDESWQALGAFLKRQCGGADAYILSGNKQAFRHL